MKHSTNKQNQKQKTRDFQQQKKKTDDIIKQNRKQSRQDRFAANRQKPGKPGNGNNNGKAHPKQPHAKFNRNINKGIHNNALTVRNTNTNNSNTKQKYGLLNRSKTIKKKRPTVNLANNANGAIGNRGRNRQQQLNKFRLQRRRNNQNVTNSQIRGVKATFGGGKPAAVRPALFAKPQNIFNRFAKNLTHVTRWWTLRMSRFSLLNNKKKTNG